VNSPTLIHFNYKITGEKMNQTIGIILSVAGLIGIIFFGIQYMADTETFSVFGADIAVSRGDYIPIVISALVLIVGLVVYRSK
jgi:ABC-type Mn2+/Zn2+ transport system permease subunit